MSMCGMGWEAGLGGGRRKDRGHELQQLRVRLGGGAPRRGRHLQQRGGGAVDAPRAAPLALAPLVVIGDVEQLARPHA